MNKKLRLFSLLFILIFITYSIISLTVYGEGEIVVNSVSLDSQTTTIDTTNEGGSSYSMELSENALTNQNYLNNNSNNSVWGYLRVDLPDAQLSFDPTVQLFFDDTIRNSGLGNYSSGPIKAQFGEWITENNSFRINNIETSVHLNGKVSVSADVNSEANGVSGIVRVFTESNDLVYTNQVTVNNGKINFMFNPSIKQDGTQYKIEFANPFNKVFLFKYKNYDNLTSNRGISSIVHKSGVVDIVNNVGTDWDGVSTIVRVFTESNDLVYTNQITVNDGKIDLSFSPNIKNYDTQYKVEFANPFNSTYYFSYTVNSIENEKNKIKTSVKDTGSVRIINTVGTDWDGVSIIVKVFTNTNELVYMNQATVSTGKIDFTFTPSIKNIGGLYRVEFANPFNSSSNFIYGVDKRIVPDGTYLWVPIRRNSALNETDSILLAKYLMTEIRVSYLSKTTGATKNLSLLPSFVDKTAPSVSIIADTVNPTKEDVLVEILGTDLESGMKSIKMDGVELTSPSATVEIKKNGTYVFTLEDNAGNVATKELIVGNIDKLAPEATYSLDNPNPTNENVSITVNATDAIATSEYASTGIKSIKNLNLLNDNMLTKTELIESDTAIFEVFDNGTYLFEIEDNVGNTFELSVPVENIDKVAPIFTVQPYNTELTKENVIVTITTDGTFQPFDHVDPNYVISDGGKTATYTFNQNSLKSFEIVDEVGNKTIAGIEISNIDKDFPQINVVKEVEDSTFTNQEYNLNAMFTEIGFGIKSVTLPDLTVKSFNLVDNKSSYSEAFPVTKNGTYTFSVEDFAGNITEKIIEVSNIDKLDPQATVKIEPKEPTNKEVTITITATDSVANDEYAESGIAYIENSGNNEMFEVDSYSFEASVNGTYSFNIYDNAGNKTEVNVVIDNIDKVAPVITQRPVSTDPTKTDVEVILDVDKGFFEDDGSGLVLENDAKTVRYTFTENGTKDFTAKDIYGNITTKTITINNIDKEEPSIQYTREIEDTQKTNKEYNVNFNISDVGIAGIKEILTPDPDKNITFETPQMSYTFDYLVSENGTYEFKVIDFAGNESSVSIEVTNINYTNPTITVTKNINIPTNKNVIATAVAEDALGNDITVSLNPSSYTFVSNGSFTFSVKDDWGNTTEVPVLVDYIDKTPPTISIPFDQEQWRKDPFQVVVTIADNGGTGYNSGLQKIVYPDNSEVTFEGTPLTTPDVIFNIDEKGSYTFKVYDIAGNVTEKTINVDKFDMLSPTATYTLNPNGLTNQNIEITVNATDASSDLINAMSGVKQIKNLSVNHENMLTETEKFSSNIGKFMIGDNGIYEFEIMDVAGNTSILTVEITSINRVSPVITVDDYIKIPTNEDITVTLHADKGEFGEIIGATLSPDKKQISYTFTEDGSLDFTVTDAWGNSTTETIIIDNIYKNPPTIDSTNLFTDWTNQPYDIKVDFAKVPFGAELKELKLPNNTILPIESSSNVTASIDGEGKVTIVNNVGDTWNGIDTIIKVFAVDELTYTNQYTVSNGKIEFTFTPNIKNMGGLYRVEFANPFNSSMNFVYNLNSESSSQTSLKYSVSKNGDYKFVVYDVAGNSSEVIAHVTNIDTLLPSATLTLSNSDFTNENIKINVVATDATATTDFGNSGIKQIKNLNISDETEIVSESSAQFEIAENGIYKFEIMDNAGNVKEETITVTNINKIPPVITVGDYVNISTKDDITVTLTTDKGEFQPFEGAVISQDKLSVSYTFTENGSKSFKVIDKWGNETVKTVTIGHIDKDAPTIDITREFEDTQKTNQDYKISANITDVGVAGLKQILTPNPANTVTFDTPTSTYSIEHTVTQNGTYTFKAIDFAGNEHSVSVVVGNINKIKPTITISKDIEIPINTDVVATATSKDALGNDITSKLNPSSHTFESNGSFTFSVTDDWGNTTEVPVLVDYIDKTPPTISIPFDQEQWRKDPFQVVVTIADNDGTEYNSGLDKLVYPNNSTQSFAVHPLAPTNIPFSISKKGVYTFKIYDVAGNVTEESINVTNFDMLAPSATYTLNPNTLINKDVEITITATDAEADDINASSGIKQIRNLNLNNEYMLTKKEIVSADVAEFKVAENGIYEFEIMDVAGNTSILKVEVTNINKIPPVITVDDYIKIPTNQDITVTLHADKGEFQPIEGLVFNDDGSVSYTFTDDGETTFTVIDDWGNKTNETIKITNIYREPPIISGTKLVTEWTNQPYDIKVDFSKETTGADLKELILPNGDIIQITTKSSYNYKISKNGDYKFIIWDVAGNSSETTINVSNIDTLLPLATLTQDNYEFINQNVTIKVDAVDEVANTDFGISGIKQIKNLNIDNVNMVTKTEVVASDIAEFIVAENGTYEFEVMDIAGNTRKFSITVTNINKTPPVITLTEIDTTPTNKDYTVYLKADKGVFQPIEGLVFNDAGSVSYTFSLNGSQDFKVIDKWGNETVKTVTIGHIDKVLPTIDITPATPSWTNEPYDLQVVFKDESGAYNSGIREVIMPDGSKPTLTDGQKSFSINYPISNNGSYNFKILDVAGNKFDFTYEVKNINYTKPTIEIQYSKHPTNKDVTVYAKSFDVEGTDITNRMVTDNHTFTQNGTFTFEVTDKWGNKTEVEVIIENIDKSKVNIYPTRQIETWTNQDYNIMVDFKDNTANVFNSGIKVITLPNGTTVDAGENLTYHVDYLITENGTYTFTVEDIAGNISSTDVVIENINKIPPVITVSNYTTVLTNEDIEVELLLDKGKFLTSGGWGVSGDDIYVTNDGMRAVYVFTENGTKEFKARDKWGNESTKIITIDNINKNAPSITIEPYTTELTDQDITVKASSNKGVLNATSYTFTKNGAFTFVAVDGWGNISMKTIVINNIDKEPPVITISDYPKEITNQSITVYANVNKGSLNRTSYTFTENGEFTFIVTDSLGRTDSKTVTITNIDKTPPVITLNDYVKTPTNQNVLVTATTNEGVLNATSYTFTENGEFTFIATDDAGNISQKKVVINNIEKDGPVITVADYVTDFTNQNVEVTATTNKGKFVTIEVTNADIITHRDDKVVLNFRENDVCTLTVRDAAGNEATRKITIDNINKVKPTITLNDIPTGTVNRAIIVTATAKDAFDTDLTDLLNMTTYTFEENGTCTFIVTDKWGNTAIKTVVIENINRVAPKIIIEPYSTAPTNQQVVIKASTDKGTLNFTEWIFTENGSVTFKAEDEAGNKSEETITITHIDKVLPTFKVTKDPEEKTNKDVHLTIVALDDNGISYIKRDTDQKPVMGSKYEMTVTENGVFKFIAGDIAGNEATIEVIVGHIDKTAPEITILPYNKETTSQDVEVTATTNEGTFSNGQATETHVFETNGAYTFIATDDVGNISEKTVIIENIDKEFAVITIQDYNKEPTNRDVLVVAVSDNGFFPSGQKTETHVFKENGSYTFVVTTLSGLKTEKTVTINNINRVPPTIIITGLEDTSLTTKSVIVNATAVDVEGDPAVLNSNTYIFEENGEFTFIATDKWGNKAEKKVTVNHINKEPPVITIEPYNMELTNQNITVKATVNKGFLELDSYTFTENGEFIFVAHDDLGNKSTRKVIISNIDKTPPVITINEYTTTPTNKNITVTAKVNEGTLEQSSYTFTDNGEFTFRATDDAGNTSEKTVKITNIVKVLPKITILPYNEDLTNNPIPVTATTDFGLFENGEMTETHIFKENGTYTFKVTDEAGNVVTKTVTITNINRVLPVITIEKDTEDPSATSVTVTATTDKGNFQGSGTNVEEHVFTENGSYTFVVIDNWGNKRVKTVTIDYINADKTPPVITVNPYSTEYTNQSILVTVRTDKGTLNSSSHLFKENGAFTFIAEDQWGNKTLKTVVIENIDKTPPNAPKFETYLNEFGQVQIFVSSNGDNLSGVAKVYTKVTGENWIDKSNNYYKLPDGNYTVSAKVEDNVGNVSEIFDFVFNNQNNKVKQLYTEINSIIEKINTTNLSFMKELRDDVTNKINSMETSSQKEFLSQNLAKLNTKIASMDGTKEDELKTTEDKVRDLFKELKKYPTNQTIIAEINRLIGSITNKAKREALIAEMNDIINGVKEPDDNDGGNSGGGNNNDDDDDDDDKKPDDSNNGGNDGNDGGNEDPPPNSNPDFWNELQKRQEEEQRRREEQERNKNDYSNVNEAELEKQKKSEAEKQKQEQEIKNYASSLTSTTSSGIETSSGSFILREKDSKTIYSGSSANVQLDSKLFEAFNHKNEKNIVLPITRTTNNLRVALSSIDFDKVNKKDLTVSIVQSDIELSVPLQKLNIGSKTFEIKVNKEDKRGYGDNKIKSDIFDISIVSASKELYRSQLSNFYNTPVELKLSYENISGSDIGVFFFNENAKVWERVSSTNNQSSKEFVVKNPEFGKYAIRELGGSISISNKDIEYLDKNGVFEGINISGLSTDSSVSKGIMISMIVNLLDLNGNVYDSFKDVPKTNPYYKDISLAQQYGIITQYGGSFGVESNTTEDEAIEFLVNASAVYSKKVKPITKEELYSKTNKDNRLTFAEASAMISYIMKNK